MKKIIAVLTATALLAAPMCVSASTASKDVSGNSSSAVTATTTTASKDVSGNSGSAVSTGSGDVSGNSGSAASTGSDGVSALEAAAAEAGMSVGEYTNNAIVSTPGLPDAAVVAQGGKVKVNGVATNMTVTLRKVNSSVLKSAKAAATGKLLNVVQVKLPVGKGNTVEADFYVKGVAAGSNVTAFQLTGGEWTALTVVEVRENHVVLSLTQSGPVMFVLN